MGNPNIKRQRTGELRFSVSRDCSSAGRVVHTYCDRTEALRRPRRTVALHGVFIRRAANDLRRRRLASPTTSVAGGAGVAATRGGPYRSPPTSAVTSGAATHSRQTARGLSALGVFFSSTKYRPALFFPTYTVSEFSNNILASNTTRDFIWPNNVFI